MILGDSYGDQQAKYFDFSTAPVCKGVFQAISLACGISLQGVFSFCPERRHRLLNGLILLLNRTVFCGFGKPCMARFLHIPLV
jgi:hypothetical protein